MEIRNFWVDIEDASGNRLGAGPLRAAFFEITTPLSASGIFSFEVIGTDPNLGALVEKRVAVCRYIDRAGATQVFGGGVIDKITGRIAADGSAVVAVSGNDLGRELTYRSVGALDLSGVAAAGVTDGPDQIMDLAPAGWTLNDGTTATAFYGAFDGESCLNALTKLGATIGEHWRIEAGRVVQWLGAASTFAASGVRAVQHVNDPVGLEGKTDIAVISTLEKEIDSFDLLTRVIPRGSGNGGVVTTLKFATDAAPSGYTLSTDDNYLKCNSAETAYGRIERILDCKSLGPVSNTTADIQAAANILLQAAYEHLRTHSSPQEFYQIGLGYAGQILLPGETVRVVYRSLDEGLVLYDLDKEFIITETENRISGQGIHTTKMRVSTIDRLPVSDADILAGNILGGQALAAHPQLGASVDTLTWRDEMDDDHDAAFRFWLGAEYTSVSRALLRFQILPLRSTVKTVSSSSPTTSSGGGATPTSETATDVVDLVNDHVHDVLGAVTSAEGAHDHTLEGHTHEVVIAAHTHTVTPVITTTYGIFEEAGGNTLAIGDLVIKLNGGDDLAGDVDDIGNGWYELDITDELVDAVFRPGQENNELVISTGTAKTARIEAQLTIRAVVQAVYYE